jgi:hypothetical protein
MEADEVTSMTSAVVKVLMRNSYILFLIIVFVSDFNVNQMMEFHWLNGIVLGSVRWVRELLLQLVGITRRVLLPPYCIF